MSEQTPEQLQEVEKEPEKIVARAFDYAASYDLRTARELLTKSTGGKVLEANPLTLQEGPQRSIVVFEYGTVVCFNRSVEECERLLDLLKTCALRPNKTVSTDDFVLYVGPRGKKPEGTDEWTVREFKRDTIILVAVVVSRSVALEYYEALVREGLAGLEQTMTALATLGRIRSGEKDLTRQVGVGLLIEHELTYNISVLDDPEIVWDGGARMNQLYRDLKREFDIDDRVKILQQKISLISRWSTFVIARLEGHRSRMLEWIIVILILSEILLVLFGKM